MPKQTLARVIISIETRHLVDALTVLETEGFIWDEKTGVLPIFPPEDSDVTRVQGDLPDGKIEAARIVAGVLGVLDVYKQQFQLATAELLRQCRPSQVMMSLSVDDIVKGPKPGWRKRLAGRLFQAIREVL